MKIEVKEFRCKFCGSRNIIRYGQFRGIHRYYCNDCQRKFADNDALPNMKTPVNQVASAVNMYYEGMSLSGIARHLDQMHKEYHSDKSIHEWVERFTEKALEETRDLKPDVGDVWVADETYLKIDGKWAYFWDIIDAKTRFLLASHLSRTRGTRDAKILMELAEERAGKKPKVIITDKLAAYVDGIEQAFGADAKHIQSKPFTFENSTNLIERFHGTLKARTKVMRGLKSLETARLFTKGWLIHYNFLRRHETLDMPPARKAGLKYPFDNWLDIVKYRPTIIKITEKPSLEPIIELTEAPSYRVALAIRPSRLAKPKRAPMVTTMTCVKRGGQYYTDTGIGTLISKKKPRNARLVRPKRSKRKCQRANTILTSPRMW